MDFRKVIERGLKKQTFVKLSRVTALLVILLNLSTNKHDQNPIFFSKGYRKFIFDDAVGDFANPVTVTLHMKLFINNFNQDGYRQVYMKIAPPSPS